MSPFRNSYSRSAIVAYACISITFALLILLGAVGTYRELSNVRAAVLQAEVEKLRTGAERRVSHIEQALADRAEDADWERLHDDPWLTKYWKAVTPLGEHQLYAAIVDTTGRVVLHSNPEYVDRLRGSRWYERRMREFGDDVVEVRENPLAGDQPALDIRIPIVVGQRQIGDYHEGLASQQLEARIAERQREVLGQRLLLMAAMLGVVGLGVVSLYYLAVRKADYRRAVAVAETRRLTEISQLASGLAHEIRNPLHAIRLNLHAFNRFLSNNGQPQGVSDELGQMVVESNREIDRVETLLQQLLGFAKPEDARNEVVDVKGEVQAAVDFLQQELARQGVEARVELTSEPVQVHMDANRLRQIMLNLLRNAEQALEEKPADAEKWIEVAVTRRNHEAIVSLADNGPGITDGDRQRIFEPFFTTKSDGAGLGLALVKRYVDEVQGEIECNTNQWGGTTFRIVLPICDRTRTRKKVVSHV